MTGTSLEAIAKANGSTVQKALDLTMANPTLQGVGAEPKVVGVAFGIGVNKISTPIEGVSGIYVVKTSAVLKAPVLKNHTDFVAKLKSQTSSYSNRVIPALKVDAKIEDNRPQFNY